MHIITTADSEMVKLYTSIDAAIVALKQDKEDDGCVDGASIFNDAGDVVCYVFKWHGSIAQTTKCAEMTAEEEQAASELADIFCGEKSKWVTIGDDHTRCAPATEIVA